MSAVSHASDLQDLPEELRQIARELEEEGVPFTVEEAAEALAAGRGPEALAFHRRLCGRQKTLAVPASDGGRFIAVGHLVMEEVRKAGHGGDGA